MKIRSEGLPAYTGYVHQPDATLVQDNPVSGTKYVILATSKHVRIIGFEAYVTWTVQPTPLEVHVTVDGVSMTYTQANPATVTNYISVYRLHVAATDQLLGTASAWSNMSFLFEGRSVKVEAETTGGTVSALNGRVKWAKKRFS